MDITELSNELNKRRIFLPLAWNNYDGAFCCGGCISAEMHGSEYANYSGFVMVNEQQLEDADEAGKMLPIMIGHSPQLDADGNARKEARIEFGEKLIAMLRDEFQIPVSWDGDPDKKMTITIRIGSAAALWVRDRYDEWEDDEWEDDDLGYLGYYEDDEADYAV